jgi:hypothetical protein
MNTLETPFICACAPCPSHPPLVKALGTPPPVGSAAWEMQLVLFPPPRPQKSTPLPAHQPSHHHIRRVGCPVVLPSPGSHLTLLPAYLFTRCTRVTQAVLLLSRPCISCRRGSAMGGVAPHHIPSPQLSDHLGALWAHLTPVPVPCSYHFPSLSRCQPPRHASVLGVLNGHCWGSSAKTAEGLWDVYLCGLTTVPRHMSPLTRPRCPVPVARGHAWGRLM